jgi:hypothetical protein
MRLAFAFTAALLLTGCGVPQELSKQAEEVHSIAAEGALVTHDAGEGATTAPFTRTHSKALRKLLGKLEPAIENPRLSRIAEDVDRSLEQLADDPGDRAGARRLERDLDKAARAADELAG